MHTYCATILHSLEAGRPMVSATVVACRGSAPRTAGARMLLHPDGSLWGTVGGGQYEAEMIAAGKRLLSGKLPENDAGRGERPNLPATLFHFSLRQVNDMDMICGGDISLLLTLIRPEPKTVAFFQQAAALEASRSDFAMAARLHFTAAAFSPEWGRTPKDGFHGHIELVVAGTDQNAMKTADPALQALNASACATPSIIPGSSGAWLYEPFPAPYRLHIFGAGHVATALARFTHLTDFPATALDDRPEFANSARFPDCDVAVLDSLNEPFVTEYMEHADIGPKDGVIILTRGHAHDRDVLAAALKTSAGYIGMIGSSSKRNQTYADLIGRGYTREDISRVCSPIGLDICAQTPEEIAVSIVAELIRWRNGRSLQKTQVVR